MWAVIAREGAGRELNGRGSAMFWRREKDRARLDGGLGLGGVVFRTGDDDGDSCLDGCWDGISSRATDVVDEGASDMMDPESVLKAHVRGCTV